MLRGCLWVVGGIIGLILLGGIYLTLNPPFGSTETGYLSRDEERRVTLSSSAPSAAHLVSIDAPARIYADAHDRFEPITVRVSVGAEADDPPTIRVFPADGIPVEALVVAEEDGQATWTIDCQQPTDERPCARRYLVVIALGGTPSGNVDAVLDVFAEQRFPKYIDTPFMVGIELDVVRLEDAAASHWTFDDASGALELSAGIPVAEVVVEAEGLPADDGGLILHASASRRGRATPTGLGAPPPVRLALLDLTGKVIADLGVRPGTPAAVALPSASGRYRLVAWWQDRADHPYDVAWRLEVGAPGDAGLALAVETEPPPHPIEPVTAADGALELQALGAPGSTATLPIVVDIGSGAGSDHLPPMLGVLRLRLLAGGDGLAGPIVLQLVPAREASGTPVEIVPVVLEPGVAREIVLEGLPGCPATRCETWAVLGTELGPASAARVEWHAELQLWPLDPFGTAAQ